MGAMLDAPWNGAAFVPPTPLDIATIASALLTRLQAKVHGIEIAHYPDRPETWRMTHRVGAALLMYKGASYGPQLDTAAVIQERRLEFEVTLMMRDLGWGVGSLAANSSPGAYAVLEMIRATLTGFRVPGCRKIHPVGEKFVERDKQGGVWNYAMSFALSTVAMEAPVLEDFPAFIKGIALDEGEQTTITVGASPYTFDSSGEIQLPHGNVFAVRITQSGAALLAQGIDFSVDRVNGIIAALAGGAVAAGDTVQIAYAYGDRVVAEAG